MKSEVAKLAVGLMMGVLVLAGCGKKGGPAEGSMEAKIDKHGDEIMASSTKGEAGVDEGAQACVFQGGCENDGEVCGRFL